MSNLMRIGGFTPNDKHRLSTYILLAHESAKHAEAVPTMLVNKKTKQALGNLMNADRSFLRLLKDNIKEETTREMKRSGAPQDLIDARVNLLWEDEWENLESNAEVLGFFIDKMLTTSKEKRRELFSLIKSWSTGELRYEHHPDPVADENISVIH